MLDIEAYRRCIGLFEICYLWESAISSISDDSKDLLKDLLKDHPPKTAIKVKVFHILFTETTKKIVFNQTGNSNLVCTRSHLSFPIKNFWKRIYI